MSDAFCPPSELKPIKEIIIVKKLTFSIVLIALSVVVGFAQQANEQRAALNETVIALDAKSGPALEAPGPTGNEAAHG